MIEKDNKLKLRRNIIIFCSYFIYQIVLLIILDILNINTSKLSTIGKNVYLILPNLVYLVFLVIIFKKELMEDINKVKGTFINTILKYTPYYIIGVIIMSMSSIIISYITGNALSENEINVREYIKLFPIYMTFSTIIYAPISEELIFRKTFRNILENDFIFIIISGTIFGLVHMTTGTFNDFLTIIPYILMGIDLSYIYYKSKNIFTTITLHSIHNLILLIIQFIGG